MGHLGGTSLFLGNDVGWGSRESLADFARVLGQYADVIVARASRHETVVELTKYAGCSVINGLTDYAHPCQALSDIYTLRELVGNLEGRTLAYIGDGNNVARSLAMACGKVGLRMVAAIPDGYRFESSYVETLRREVPDLDLVVTADPAEAVREATAVYTDVWASMGQESESDVRRKVFAPYQVNQKLMKAAPRDAYFMHCMPRHRGEEVTDDVFDSRQSIVVQQAGNRMHVQKGILAWLLGSQP
jgi:ornithine carbamoyltransferase